MKKNISNIVYFLLIQLGLLAPTYAGFNINASLPVVLEKTNDNPNELNGEIVYHVLTAEIAGRRNLVEHAIENYLTIAKATKHPDLAKRATKVALYANDIESAKVALKYWLEGKSTDFEAHTILATIDLHSKNSSALTKTIRRFYQASVKSETPEKFYEIVPEIVSTDKELSMMESAVKSLQKKFPHDVQIKMTLARLSLINGQYNKAQKQIEPVLLTKPLSENATLLKAKTLFAQDEIQASISVLRRGLNSNKDSRAVRALLAKIYLATKDFRNAKLAYAEILTSDPKNVDALVAMAMINIEESNINTAKQFLSRYQKLVPNDPSQSFYQGYLAEKQEDYSAALKHYAKVNKGTKRMAAQLQIATVLAKQDRTLEARQHLLFVKPQNAYEHIQIILAEANILGLAKLYEDAHKLITSAIDKYGYQVDLTYARGIINEKLKRYDEMELDLKRILAKRPLDPDVLNALGFSLINHGDTKRHQEGLDYITKALRVSPNDPAIIDSMGWAYYKTGKNEKALKYLKKAYSISNDGEIAAHLGEVMWLNGQKLNAVNVWKAALKYNPQHEFLIKTIKRFSKEILDNI